MDYGSQAAELGRLDKARAQQRHRNAREVEIEENTGVHEEGARKGTCTRPATEHSSTPSTPEVFLIAPRDRRSHDTVG